MEPRSPEEEQFVLEELLISAEYHRQNEEWEEMFRNQLFMLFESSLIEEETYQAVVNSIICTPNKNGCTVETT